MVNTFQNKLITIFGTCFENYHFTIIKLLDYEKARSI